MLSSNNNKLMKTLLTPALNSYEKGYYSPYPNYPTNINTPTPSLLTTTGTDINSLMSGSVFEDTRPEFEKVIDSIFTPEEKLDFLKNLGYEFIKGTIYKVGDKENELIPLEQLGSISDVFIKEMTIKFKNLLLSKVVLKMKI